MIHHITGVITHHLANAIIIEAAGVGYELRVSQPQHWCDGTGAPVQVLTRQIIRETSHELFGFRSEDERTLFDLLNTITGLGPKTAMGILSAVDPEYFRNAVADSDLVKLTAIKGLGKKTAERILVELRDKVGIATIWKDRQTSTDPALQDAILALMALGHSKSVAEKAATAARKENPKADAQGLTKAALTQ